MKSLQKNRFLMFAISLSLLAHGVLLALHFAAPRPMRVAPLEPALEVILVNARHAKKPLKAEALAQANLDGGGNADAGRAKSPLPEQRKTEAGDSVLSARRRIAQLEQAQALLLAQMQHSTRVHAPVPSEKSQADTILPSAADLLDSSKAFARTAAEISATIDEQNKRPRKTLITPSTQEVGYAMYYKTMQKRIEDVGTLNFPKQNGRKLYGELVVYIPVFQDGTIYQKDGGVQIRQSSGSTALDDAALAIVRRAAPFGRFPPNMLSSEKEDLWVIITRFRFTRDEKMAANLSQGDN